jgi:TolB-like protein
VASEHCRRELNFAQEEGREVVAIHLEATEVPAGLRLVLNNRQAILRHELSGEEFHKRLIRAVQGGGSSAVAPVSATVEKARRPKAAMALAAVALAAVAAWWLFTRDAENLDTEPLSVTEVAPAPTPDLLPNSVAVLPFTNLSPDPENAYFAAGIHEEIINRLSGIRDLSVIARTSVMQYAGAERPITEIAEELKVATVMEGSVRYAGNRVRITMQLTDAESGANVWSEAYEENLQDIFKVQLAIATKIANTLQAELSAEERARIARRGTRNAQAHGHYIRALAGLRNLASTAPVHRDLDMAISLDSEFADALAFKAQIHGFEAGYGHIFIGDSFNAADQRRYIELAEEYALRALALDGKQARALMILRDVALHDRDWEAVNLANERAYELSPNDYTVLAGAAWNAANMGDIEAAIGLHERAIELNPSDAGIVWNFSELLYWTQQWAAARDHAILVTEMIPDSPLGFAQLARVSAHLKDADAVRRYAALTELRNPTAADYAYLAIAYAGIEDFEEAKRIFQLAGGGDLSRTPDLSVQYFLHLAVADYGTALDYLERAVDENFPFMFCVGVHFRPDHPVALPLQEMPRYQEIVARLAKPLDLPR